VGLIVALVVMPIPSGKVLPALALTLIGLGLVCRDGAAVVLGLVMAGLAIRCRGAQTVVGAGLSLETQPAPSKSASTSTSGVNAATAW